MRGFSVRRTTRWRATSTAGNPPEAEASPLALRGPSETAASSCVLLGMPHFPSSKGCPYWAATLRRAKVPYFRIYDLRSTYATRLSAGGVADEWVTQLLRQRDGSERPCRSCIGQ